jgi:PHD/YefM family antitoxin component YafN of YafNO toxin-antitoxin module
MNTIPFSEVRERFTDIAQKVQFEKQIFITKKNNKPAVGIVPVEYVHLLLDIFKKAKESKDIADVMKQYMVLVEPEEFEQLKAMIETPPKPTKRMLASARSAMRVFDEFKNEDI